MIKSLINATLYSLSGLGAAFREEPSFRLEIILTVILIPFAFYITSDKFECALMICVLFLVLVTELLNSGIEAAVDRISDEKHPLSKKAKDCGSAAVLMSIILAVIVWYGAVSQSAIALF